MSPKILILSALCAVLFSTHFPAAVSQNLRGYVGCYKDAENRAFEHGSGYVNNIEHCLNNCRKKKYTYSGLETIFGKIECWCSNKIGKYGKSDGCNKPCKSRGGLCGGKWALSVYKSYTLRLSVGPEFLLSRGYKGCYKDKENRAFQHGSGYVTKIDDCINRCKKKKYNYAGLETLFGKIECWCSNQIGKYGKSDSCNNPCKNGGGMCGGMWALSVYTTFAKKHLPNRGYVGCYKDARKRAFEHGSGNAAYIDMCIHMCKRKKYKYAGLESIFDNIECWCGNTYDKYGKSDGCNSPCYHRGGMCGGPWALSVYRTDVLHISGKGEGYLKYKGYVGCFNDHSYRDLPEDKGDVFHIDQCIERCQRGKFLYAGLQAKHECFCGDNVGLYGKSLNCDRDCKMKGGKCGGAWANSVYKTSGRRYSGYVGCFHDKKDRDLTVNGGSLLHSYISGCIIRCRRKGYKYAGLQYHKECRCGNHYGRYGKAERCDTPCGSGPGMCGGAWKNSVYHVG